MDKVKRMECYVNNDYNHFVVNQTVSNTNQEKTIDLNRASKTQLKAIEKLNLKAQELIK